MGVRPRLVGVFDCKVDVALTTTGPVTLQPALQDMCCSTESSRKSLHGGPAANQHFSQMLSKVVPETLLAVTINDQELCHLIQGFPVLLFDMISE